MIGLNRPEKRNALGTALSEQLSAAIRRAHDDAKVGLI